MTQPKLIIQIPSYNEEKTLKDVLDGIPKHIPGVGAIETLIIDDGSRDRTLEIAEAYPVDHILRHRQNRGLAITFADGMHESLRLGADIIVNIDGDNQHPANRIPDLIAPILEGTHDIVVADRGVRGIKEFSATKKLFQRLGSKVVRWASHTNVPDAPCGFRAYSREAALSTNIITTFSYTMETIIQAGHKRLAVTHVAIPQRPKTRESRLFTGIGQHISRSAVAILRSYTMYQPFKVFLLSGFLVFLIGTIPYWLVLYRVFAEPYNVGGHVQSLILGAVFMILGIMFVMIGIVADLLSINRKLLEDTLYRLKKIEYGESPHKTDHPLSGR
ncbi:MAG: hypothetical protein JWN01_596 [Patescibacteria group bacterium]|nr:hypothetical protein [Patescibacteria group bacterium]